MSGRPILPEYVQAARELCDELKDAGMVWHELLVDARGWGKHPQLIWDALVAERVENERLMHWVDDLQSGMYVNCVYCGHRYGPKANAPVSMAQVLKEHIAECPKHPMSELMRVLDAARHALISYANGNAAPALAEEMLEACDKALQHAKGGRG